ncbi:MAG: hypothetical protein CL693_13450 [Cellvibrionaceae bacterium]|nr:hypothetical protein [Cellvibrionaceae bacterium]|tara:strand:+ start:12546 stop:12929 length:384 start_codon:yes stop_codon:yes gene_type:complete
MIALLCGCGTAYSLRDTPYDTGIKISYGSNGTEQVEEKLQALIDGGKYELLSRETFSGNTVILLESGAQLNLTAGQRGVKTGRLFRLVMSSSGSESTLYVLAHEKFGLKSAETDAAAQALANQLSPE